MRYLWAALVAGAVFAAPASLDAQATSMVERVTESNLSFSDFNPCNGDPIEATGSITTTVRRTVDANGITHEATTVQGRFDGVGESGAKYMIKVPEHKAETYVAGEDTHHQNYTVAIHLVGQGQAPNFISRLTMHFNILADGTAKLDFEHVAERCLGKQ